MMKGCDAAFRGGLPNCRAPPAPTLCQVAMLTRGEGPAPGRRLGIGGPPGSVSVPMPAGGPLEGAASERPLALALGWALRHRRGLLLGYLAFLHVLVYYVATLWGQCRQGGGASGGAGDAGGGLPGT